MKKSDRIKANLAFTKRTEEKHDDGGIEFDIPQGYTTQEFQMKALAISKANPGKYIIANTIFMHGYVHVKDRLHVFDPSDAHHGMRWYILNGKIKPFSEKQKLADQNATPTGCQ